MVAQHQKVGLAQGRLQARLFFISKGHAFVGVIRQRGQYKRRLLADRKHARRLRTDCHAGPCVGVQHTTCIMPRFMHGAVNDKAGRVNRERRVNHLVALVVHLDQAGGRDFIKHQAIGVDEKVVRPRTRHRFGQLGADVGKDQIAPAVQRHQPVASGQVAAQLPFFGSHDVFE